MGKDNRGPEVRLSQGTVIAIIAILALVVIFWPNIKSGAQAAFNVAPTTPAGGGTPTTPTTPTAPVTAPLIEKTKVYLSTIDQADFTDDKQKNLVAGSAKLVKSGNLLETVTTLSTTGASSTAEFNGGDVVSVIGDATGYYANAVENVAIKETLQPVEVFIRAAGVPTIKLLDENGAAVTTIDMATNDVTDVYTMRIERPGDDSWYQLCGVAADYVDDEIEVQFKTDGSFNKGVSELADVYDKFDTAGYEAVWKIDSTIKNYDRTEVDWLFKGKKDTALTDQTVTFTVFDCEWNLQNGKIVYSEEDSAHNDVGLADIDATVDVNAI